SMELLSRNRTTIQIPFVNDIVIGEETDVGPDGSYVSHLALYLRAMRDRRRQHAPVREVQFACISRRTSRSIPDADRSTDPCSIKQFAPFGAMTVAIELDVPIDAVVRRCARR